MEEAGLPFSVDPTASNHFAWVRTVMGLQRTHMAAVRTSVALIGFGFTVAEFLRRIRIPGSESARLGEHGARDMGLLLIGAGVLSLALFTHHFRKAAAYLSGAAFEPITGLGRRTAVWALFRGMTAPVYLISCAVMLIGAVAFVSVLVRS
jgi:putative membrane protein